MPVEVLGDVRAVDEATFAEVCFRVMGCVFSVRNEMGPFFIESIYQQEICNLFEETQQEIPIIVSHDQFRHRYSIDTVFENVAVFEWKSAEQLSDKHRAQLLNYLMLCEIEHGKLVNLRPDTVKHEFINSPLTRRTRQSFELRKDRFEPQGNTESRWAEFMTDALRDWGTGLDLRLYEAATEYAFGGAEQVVKNVAVLSDTELLGRQKTRITPDGSIVKITALSKNKKSFVENARRFLNHVDFPVIQWLNVANHSVSFQTIRKREHNLI